MGRVRGTYTAASLFADDYVLAQQNDQWGFSRLTTAATLQPFDVYAHLPSTEAFLPIQDVSLGIAENPPLDLWSLATNGTQEISNLKSQTIYDLQGRRVSQPTKGLYIINGRCVIIK